VDLLKQRIISEGKVLPGNIIQVSSFLNHMVDPELIGAIGKEFANVFRDSKPTKVITLEASGISMGLMTALELHIPLIIAKKYSTINLTGNIYSAEVYSYTRKESVFIRISKEFLDENDRVLIIDDFLAYGGATNGLIQIINEANAKLIGIGICIEKSFQQGAVNLIDQHANLHSLVRIKSLENGIIEMQ
jgi:xanthine phosphoribosyltransferase